MHEHILERFQTLVMKERLAQAYLFNGSPYTGKFQAALDVAKLVNCQNFQKEGVEFFCDDCSSCSKIAAVSHPDIQIVEADGASIKIEQIRGILSQVKLRPYFSKYKVFIIKNVEDLTPESSNALLKTLEEPAANSLLILTTSGLDKVLDTIKSRCHIVHFFAPPVEVLETSLINQYNMNPAAACFLAHFCEGSLEKARELDAQGFVAEKNDWIDRFVFARDSEDFIKSISANRESVLVMLKVLIAWMRDALLLKSGADIDVLMHADRAGDLQRFARPMPFESLEEIHKEMVNAYRMVGDNFNVKVPLSIIREMLAASRAGI